MHDWLKRIGYRSFRSGIGVNARCPELSVELLVKTVDAVYAETGMKVTLIGHSLGGLLTRGAALARPEKIASVVTLRSPVNGIAAHPLIVAAAERRAVSATAHASPSCSSPFPKTSHRLASTRSRTA